MKKTIFTSVLLLFVFTFLSAQYITGTTYYGTNQYVEYRAGALPIIISAPHGGSLEPTNIPDRTCAACTVVRDLNTKELAIAIHTAITNTFGCPPHLIISNLHRKKLDPNREIVEAAQGIPAAEVAWREFHGFITSARNAVISSQKRGILIDIHGHGHTIQRLELGYLLEVSDLQQSDSALSAQTHVDESSIRRLVADNLARRNLAQLVRGSQSLGTLMATANYPSVPSAAMLTPNTGEPYFNGGYITDVYGSRNNSAVDAIQIETHYTGVRDNATNQANFGRQLAAALKTFLTQHYFPTVACKTVSVNELDKTHYRLYPNPVSHELSLESTTDVKNIVLLNALGQIVLKNTEGGIQSQKLNIGALPTGIYQLNFEINGQIFKEKIVKL
jgi:Secretion system C-terminal sorting domain